MVDRSLEITKMRCRGEAGGGDGDRKTCDKWFRKRKDGLVLLFILKQF